MKCGNTIFEEQQKPTADNDYLYAYYRQKKNSIRFAQLFSIRLEHSIYLVTQRIRTIHAPTNKQLVANQFDLCFAL